MRFVNVFDLDFTLIDSEHRYNKYGDANKGLDLDYWLDHSTEKYIMKDKLLPLTKIYFEFKKTNFINIAVTARTMSNADYKFLKENDLHFDMILHRENSQDLDHVLKEKRLDKLFKETDLKPFLAFDDKEENLEIFKKFGFSCMNAVKMNEVLSTME